MECPDISLNYKLVPQHMCEIFRGGNTIFEIGHVEIEILVVELLNHIQHHPLEIEQIDHHAGSRIDVT